MDKVQNLFINTQLRAVRRLIQRNKIRRALLDYYDSDFLFLPCLEIGFDAGDTVTDVGVEWKTFSKSGNFICTKWVLSRSLLLQTMTRQNTIQFKWMKKNNNNTRDKKTVRALNGDVSKSYSTRRVREVHCRFESPTFHEKNILKTYEIACNLHWALSLAYWHQTDLECMTKTKKKHWQYGKSYFSDYMNKCLLFPNLIRRSYLYVWIAMALWIPLNCDMLPFCEQKIILANFGLQFMAQWIFVLLPLTEPQFTCFLEAKLFVWENHQIVFINN